MENIEFIDGKHYSEYNDKIEYFLKNSEYDEAIKLLLKIIETTERASYITGQGVAPWYYDKLSIVYKKLKNTSEAAETLKRYLCQIKARGSHPKKIYNKYLKTQNLEEKKIQKEIYELYIETINSTELKTIKYKCDSCKQIGLYPIPNQNNNNEIMFGACCPYCCESLIVTG